MAIGPEYHIEAKGFKAVERPSVQIEVATDVRADFALQPPDPRIFKEVIIPWLVKTLEVPAN